MATKETYKVDPTGKEPAMFRFRKFVGTSWPIMAVACGILLGLGGGIRGIIACDSHYSNTAYAYADWDDKTGELKDCFIIAKKYYSREPYNGCISGEDAGNSSIVYINNKRYKITGWDYDVSKDIDRSYSIDNFLTEHRIDRDRCRIFD